NNRPGAVHYIAAGEDLRTRGMSFLVSQKKSAAVDIQSFGGVDQFVFRSLADGDDHAVCRVKLLSSGNLFHRTVFLFQGISKDDAVIGDFHRDLAVNKFHAFQNGVLVLVLACRNGGGAGEALQRTDSFSKRRAGNIHGGVSGADHDHMLAQVETVRVVQVIDPKVYMTQGLPFDVQRVGTPHSGSDKNRFVAVAEQVVNGDGSADGRVWTNFDIFQDQM